jgi:hypothetical protein
MARKRGCFGPHSGYDCRRAEVQQYDFLHAIERDNVATSALRYGVISELHRRYAGVVPDLHGCCKKMHTQNSIVQKE